MSMDQIDSKQIKKLKRAENFQEFKNTISDYLAIFEFSHWCYNRLDIPRYFSIRDRIGTLPDQYNEEYISSGYYRRDLLENMTMKNYPIVSQVSMMGYFKEAYDGCDESRINCIRSIEELSGLNSAYGFDDCWYKCIDVDDNLALFIAFSQSKIKDNVLQRFETLDSFSMVVHKVGIEHYPEYFSHPGELAISLKSGRLGRILSVMIDFEIDFDKAVTQLGFSPQLLSENQLSDFVESIGARSSQEAYDMIHNR